jgi:glycosyltransferase involved in cell wall biosynthesis
MTRIAYFAPLLTTGGTQRHLQQVLGLLDRARFEARVFTLRPGGEIEGELRAAGVSVSSLDVPGRLTSPGTLRALLRTARALRAARIDVVHGYQWRPALIGTLAARLAGVPLLLASKRSLTGSDRSAERAWRRIARHVDTVLVNADALRVEGEQSGMRCRWTLLQNGIDVDAFGTDAPSGAAKVALGLERDRPVVGTIGRLEWRKGQDVLIAAAACLRDRRPAPQLLVVGDGPTAADLRHQAQALGVAGLVRFTGTLEDVRPALAAMDVFALPSREEGMSNALMEAMAAGRPIVATDVGGNGEVLDRGRLGLLVPSDDPVALADAIARLLDDAPGAAARAERAREFVTARWDARAMVAELEAFYDRRLAAHGRGWTEPADARRDPASHAADGSSSSGMARRTTG